MRQLYESILSGAQLNKSVLGEAQLTESIFSIPNNNEEVKNTLITRQLCKLFNIEQPDRAKIEIKKNGSYTDIYMDLRNLEQVTIKVNIDDSHPIPLDYAHMRCFLTGAQGSGERLLLRSLDSRINTHNFFSYLEVSEEMSLVIQNSSIDKDITLKSNSDTIECINYDDDSMYIQANLICDRLVVTDHGHACDLTHLGAKSKINKFDLTMRLPKSGSNDDIIKDVCTDVKNVKTLLDELQDMKYNGPQISPKIFDILKLPPINLIREKAYRILFDWGIYSDNLPFTLAKKGTGHHGRYGYIGKTKQEDPKISTKWDVFY